MSKHSVAWFDFSDNGIDGKYVLLDDYVRLLDRIDKLCEVVKTTEELAVKHAQEAGKLAAELDALRKQEPVGFYWERLDTGSPESGLLFHGLPDRDAVQRAAHGSHPCKPHYVYAYPVPPAANTLEQATKYAHDIVTWLHRDHYANAAAFEPFDDILGLLSQIDNMICGWKESPAAVADVPWVITVESSEVYSPSGDKWKDMVEATPAPVAQKVLCPVCEQKATLLDMMADMTIADAQAQEEK